MIWRRIFGHGAGSIFAYASKMQNEWRRAKMRAPWNSIAANGSAEWIEHMHTWWEMAETGELFVGVTEPTRIGPKIEWIHTGPSRICEYPRIWEAPRAYVRLTPMCWRLSIAPDTPRLRYSSRSVQLRHITRSVLIYKTRPPRTNTTNLFNLIYFFNSPLQTFPSPPCKPLSQTSTPLCCPALQSFHHPIPQTPALVCAAFSHFFSPSSLSSPSSMPSQPAKPPLSHSPTPIPTPMAHQNPQSH